MAQYPYMPLWVADYLADTTHLTTAQHGAYLLILMAMWRSPDCSVPDDDRQLARITAQSVQSWKRMRQVITKMLSPSDDHGSWSQKRLHKEWEKTIAKSSVRKGSAEKRWSKKVLGHDANAYAKPMQSESEPEPNILSKKESSVNVTPAPDLELLEQNRLKRYPSFEAFALFCREYARSVGKPDRDWQPLFDYFEGPGWRMKGEPIVKWQATARRAIREDWQTAKQSEAGAQYVTREMVEDFCRKKGWTHPLPDYAWGKLMSGKYYKTPITNREDFRSAMEAIGSDWTKENK